MKSGMTKAQEKALIKTAVVVFGLAIFIIVGLWL